MSSYVYGFVRAGSGWSPQVSGLEDAPVRLVVHQRVAALVSDVASELAGRRKEIIRHADVIGHALASGDVLPLQFGTMLADDTAVVHELLEPQETKFVDLLDEIDGRVEVRLRGYYDEERAVAEVVSEQPGLRRRGAKFGDRLQLGEHIATAIANRRAEDEVAIVERLRPRAEDVALDEPASPLMVLNATFLLAREGLERFDEAVADLGERLGERVQLKYVGPFPPVTFVDLRLEGASAWDYSRSS